MTGLPRCWSPVGAEIEDLAGQVPGFLDTRHNTVTRVARKRAHACRGSLRGSPRPLRQCLSASRNEQTIWMMVQHPWCVYNPDKECRVVLIPIFGQGRYRFRRLHALAACGTCGPLLYYIGYIYRLLDFLITSLKTATSATSPESGVLAMSATYRYL